MSLNIFSQKPFPSLFPSKQQEEKKIIPHRLNINTVTNNQEVKGKNKTTIIKIKRLKATKKV